MIRILNEVVGEQSTVDGLCQTFSWKVNQLAKVLGKDIVESDLLNGIMKFDARWDGNGEYKLTTDRLSKSNIDAYHAVEGALTSVKNFIQIQMKKNPDKASQLRTIMNHAK